MDNKESNSKVIMSLSEYNFLCEEVKRLEKENYKLNHITIDDRLRQKNKELDIVKTRLLATQIECAKLKRRNLWQRIVNKEVEI